jgi:hypothetical protein
VTTLPVAPSSPTPAAPPGTTPDVTSPDLPPGGTPVVPGNSMPGASALLVGRTRPRDVSLPRFDLEAALRDPTFVARDPATGKRLRYGFVDIATERAAKLAVAAMNGTAIDGHNLDVRISERPSSTKKPPKPRLAIRRTPPSASRDNTEDYVSDGALAPRVTPRRQPTFQVERRSLPRRF